MTQEQKKLMVLQAVKLNLNGKCSNHKNTCPALIAVKIFQDIDTWACSNCRESFGYVINWDQYEFECLELPFNPCPCSFCNNEEEPLIALDDEIERLTKKYTKWI